MCSNNMIWLVKLNDENSNRHDLPNGFIILRFNLKIINILRIKKSIELNVTSIIIKLY